MSQGYLMVAASLVLSVLAAVVLFRTYIAADDLSDPRRALLYLCSLILFGCGFALWMLSCPQ